MNLLIVESPNKIKKLKALLGQDWEVAASVGHIRDLPTKELSIDRANGYKMLYQINPDKKKVVDALRSKVRVSGKENVYLATDPDREGEAIAFHLSQVLDLNYKTVKRSSFQELTELEVKKAVNNPKKLDMNLVFAQETRRAIDRLVGYGISPVLWKKLYSGLTAGRVQSVALRLIVEREREILGFADKFSFIVKGEFFTERGDRLKARRKNAYANANDAEIYLAQSKQKRFSITDITKSPVERKALPSYSTSSLQQDGVKKLKMDVKRVMDVAQKLFEGGHITYMRTDSVNLSDEAIGEARTQIIKDFGIQYFQERKYRNKPGAQEAHEAIRPTHWEEKEAGETEEEKQLYNLIYRRALASQMKNAIFDQTIITISSNIPDDIFISSAKVLTFDGYLKVYQDELEDESEEEEQNIGAVEKGEVLKLIKLEAIQSFLKPPKRYDQATLVKELEKRQIGRPSTYSSIINTILFREYVKPGVSKGRRVKGELLTLENSTIKKTEFFESIGADKNKLLPTEKGSELCSFLEENFREVIDYDFTAKCEEEFDIIAEGKKTFSQVVPVFDKKLESWISKVESSYKDAPTEEKILGQFEGLPIYVKQGKFGQYLSHNNTNYSYSDTSMTLSAAIHLIKSKRELKPKIIGSFQGKEVQTGKGKYGTYILYNNKYYNIDTELEDVTFDMAVEIINTKTTSNPTSNTSPVIAKIGRKYEIRTGKFGLYVTDGKINVSLPKSVTEGDAQRWTTNECKVLIESKKKKKS